ncbi:DNA-binding transcriptional regulator, LysR family [Actinopolyspora xinjiangensis]|uniref:DNA-binding transcriptional regulator, LysR family n=1 Tax=Actinopolyspora xinjiangensis TaxID=405564 RepID=A0A1H0WVT4_9ACTN|nr:LysR family transcriptional regulator [Actinopolyspora xinjiangensis]SDP94762.1 DNA-binding transcriptional regulator, LysR family [Actinopolyspora xinjiangensis]
MEIFHLRYFLAVAENLSFSRAARQLHMATSPLSQRIRDLERELDVTLFERDSHNVALTEAGNQLLPVAQDVLNRFDDIPGRMRRMVVNTVPTVFIGIAPGLHSWVRERIGELERRCATSHNVKRWPANTDSLVRSVRRGELDMALVHLPVHAVGLEVREVMREPLGAVLPRKEFGDHTSVSLAELADYSYVVPAPDTAPVYFEQLERRLDKAGIKKRIHLSTGDYSGIGELVGNGSAFAISMLDPESSMHKYRTGEQIVLPFEDFSPALSTGLVWRCDRDERDSGLYEALEAARKVLPDENCSETAGRQKATR